MSVLVVLLVPGGLGADMQRRPTPSEAHVLELAADLNGTDVARQEAALEEIAELGPAARAAIPGIIQYVRQLSDSDWKGNWRRYEYAVDVLGMMGPNEIPTLLTLLDDENDAVRLAAQMVLGSFGSEAVASLKAVLEADDPRGMRHATAAGALTRMDRSDALPAREALLSALRRAPGKEPGVRADLIRAIGHLGSDGQPATPLLVESLADSSRIVQHAAIQALREVAVRDAIVVRALGRTLVDGHLTVRVAAANALKDMGVDATPALKQLITAAASGVSPVVEPAVVALGNIGPRAGEAGPTLQRLLDDSRSNQDERLAKLVHEALAKIRPSPMPK